LTNDEHYYGLKGRTLLVRSLTSAFYKFHGPQAVWAEKYLELPFETFNEKHLLKWDAGEESTD
jgi:hypothetical protein